MRLGELGHDDCVRFRQIRTDVVDNQIDTLGKAFLGLTIACARCHDHKLDPIPTADYYALYGVLTSARMVTRTADLPDTAAAAKHTLRELKPRIRAELTRLWWDETAAIPRYLRAADRARRHLPVEAGDLALPVDRLQRWVDALDRAKRGMEDPLYPLMRMANDAGKPDFAERWRKLSEDYTAEAPQWLTLNSSGKRIRGGHGL